MHTRGRKRISDPSDENTLSERHRSASDLAVKRPRRSVAAYSTQQQQRRSPRATRSLRSSTKLPLQMDKSPVRRRSEDVGEQKPTREEKQKQQQEEESELQKLQNRENEEVAAVDQPLPSKLAATKRKRAEEGDDVNSVPKKTPKPIVTSDRVTRRQAKTMDDNPFSMIPKMPDGTPIEVPMNRELQSLLAAAEQELKRAPKPTEPKLDLSAAAAAAAAAAVAATNQSAAPRKRNKEPSAPRQITLTVREPTPPPSPIMKRQRVEKQNPEPNPEQQLFYKTFGFKLTEEEADIVRGTPNDKDRQMFARAKHLATKTESSNRHSIAETVNGAPSKIPKIEQIQFGDHLIDTWFAAPYPEEYSRCQTLYICEYCLKYMNSAFVAQRHKLKCTAKHPPGDEIYRDGRVSIFEVDGRKNKMYCQNLCLLAKMFLDHKTLYYDVEPFLFYILTEVDDRGCHFVGYFSKEKRSSKDYNVSCILTLPVCQRKGYGQYLIDFSYLLTREEKKTGSPEKPLSDLGLISYRSYWKTKVFEKLKENQTDAVSIDDLSYQTGMTVDDVVLTLQAFDMLKKDEQGRYYIEMNKKLVDIHLQKMEERREQRQLPHINPRKLTWTPFVLSRDRLAGIAGEPQLAADNSAM